MTSPKVKEEIVHLETTSDLRVIALEEETPPHLHSKTILIIVVCVFQTYLAVVVH